MARVYGMYNRTRKEQYYGSTKRLLKERIKEHASGRCEATNHWKFGRDKIYWKTIRKGLSAQKATDKAHQLEARKPPPGWKTIQTGGR